MDKELKKKWAKALLSGDYTQGRRCLRRKTNRGYRYCCLGVLLDVYDNKCWVRHSEASKNRSGNQTPSRDFNKTVGLTPDKERHLIKMNDHLLMNFKSIAYYIKERL